MDTSYINNFVDKIPEPTVEDLKELNAWVESLTLAKCRQFMLYINLTRRNVGMDNPLSPQKNQKLCIVAGCIYQKKYCLEMQPKKE